MNATTGPGGLWPAPRARSAVTATVDLPGSKSLTNRELILSALAEGPGTVQRALRSRDTSLMAGALTSLGSPVDTAGSDWLVRPGIGPDQTSTATIDCGLAGTVMRFAPAAAALRSGASIFDGDPAARTRPMEAIARGLAELGIDVATTGGFLPLRVAGTGTVRGGAVVIDASASSQFVSALLLSAPRFEAGIDLRHQGAAVPSLPHIEMTVACLRARGVEVDDSEMNRWRVLPGPIAALDVRIEPDLSNAAPFLMLAMTSGGAITIPGWPEATTQAGDALRGLLAQMGAEVELSDEGLTVRGTGVIEGIDADLHDVGELAPAIAALAALAAGPSRLRGIAHIRGHETDRLAALATELRGLGGDVTETEDGLAIRPAALRGGVFHTYADHRMAHAAVIIGSAVDGVVVENPETTAKTFPGFERVWAGLFDQGGAAR